MKVKIVAIVSVLLGAVLIASCGVIPGLGNNSNTPPSTPIGPINSNYSNAISPAQQLIMGTMNLQGNLAVTPDEAAKLLPYWEAYQTLVTSNTAAPEELQAALVGVEQAMTSDQVQAIANMKLTRQNMGAILQENGISFGARGTGTPGAGRGFGGGGFGGGIPGVTGRPGGGGFGGGGFGGGFGGATPNPQAIATFRARAASGAANEGLVRLIIRFLQQKNPALMPSATPSATGASTPMPSETPTP